MLSSLRNRLIHTTEKINFGYSIKNIEKPQNRTYSFIVIIILHLSFILDKVAIQGMRSKALCINEKQTNGVKTENLHLQRF